MKKYILTSLLTLFAYIVSYGQISGSVKWEQNVDFFIQIGDEYTEISIESMCYTEEVGSPKLPYCVKSFVSVSYTHLYVIPQDAQNANLLIYDMNGKQIEQFVLTQKGMGSIVLEGSHLEAGMYLYSLIVDSKVIDVKRMILTN